MAFCKDCGEEIRDDSLFCPYCGVSLEPQDLPPELEKGSEPPDEPPDTVLKKHRWMRIGVICAAAAACIIIGVVSSGIAVRDGTGASGISSGGSGGSSGSDAGADSYIVQTETEPDSLAPEYDPATGFAGTIDENGRLTMGKWRGKPIIWRVLNVQDDKALVISEDVLTVRQYDGLEALFGERLADVDIDWNRVKVTWSNSEIREWLNSDFVREAFSEGERDCILMTEISTPGGSRKEVDGGADTVDEVFLLSVDEAEYYLPGKKDRIAYFEMSEADMDYIRKKSEEDYGSDVERDEALSVAIGSIKAWWWWLRSPGYGNTYASGVRDDGVIGGEGGVNFVSGGVRPAMYVRRGS